LPRGMQETVDWYSERWFGLAPRMQKDYNRLLAGNVDFGGMAIGSMHTPNDERAFSSSKFI
jgi:hypothetical protein